MTNFADEMQYSETTYEGVRICSALFPGRRREMHAYLTPTQASDKENGIKAICRAADRLIQESGLRPVFKRWLMSDATNQRNLIPDDTDCAVSAIGQSPLDGSKAFLLLLLEDDADFSDRGNGIWKDSRGRIMAVETPAVPTASPLVMTVEYLERLARALEEYGGALKDNCLRTWFFVRDIDNNYPGVVHGRNGVFAREGLSKDTHFIASTGIGGNDADPARPVSFNAIADTRVVPSQMTHLRGRSHLNPTYEYGVAFERATAVDYADRRHVYISGTASIDHKGQIVAPGDVKAQTLRMLENISVLLKEGECGWSDVVHMTVYLRDIADHDTVRGIIETRLPRIPKAFVLAPVCRPGWLVEAECMAIKEGGNPQFAAY